MSDRYEVEAAAAEGVALPLALERVEEVVRHVLGEEGVEEAELSIALLEDEGIAELNQGYLSHAGATDVISFALHAEGERPLGDIYIGVGQAARQAEEAGVGLEEEILRLAVHGTLHVLGWDHPGEEDRESTPMYRRQEELLASFLDRSRPAGR